LLVRCSLRLFKKINGKVHKKKLTGNGKGNTRVRTETERSEGEREGGRGGVRGRLNGMGIMPLMTNAHGHKRNKWKKTK
jgi:hypothetical protein